LIFCHNSACFQNCHGT